jgi:indolepyruvate ferredoxin oxidoreductase beta subunit
MDIQRIVFIGVGGQGNLLSSRILGEAAMQAGLPVNVSEVHGMAQRGGVVESDVVLGGAMSSIVSEGEADVLLGFEPAETLRALGKCSQESTVIINITPQVPFTVAVGQGVYPSIPDSLRFLKSKVKRLIAINANALAEQAGSVLSVNIVMLGALAQSQTIPLGIDQIKEAIKRNFKQKLWDVNLKAFDLGYEAAGKQ